MAFRIVPFIKNTEPVLVICIINDTQVYKRRHVSRIDWAQVMAKVMASRKDLRTQAAVARKSGVAQSTIGRILRGEVNPQFRNAERIAKAFGMSVAELTELGEEGEVVTSPSGDLNSIKRSTYVPLISWAQAGSFASVLDSLRAGDEREWMPRPNDSGNRTFALRVRGESMEPGYQHGDILFVDPEGLPEDGKDVVVRFEERDEVVLRRVLIEGKRQYLKPANPSLPDKVIEIATDPNARIIGVVIGKWVEK